MSSGPAAVTHEWQLASTNDETRLTVGQARIRSSPGNEWFGSAGHESPRAGTGVHDHCASHHPLQRRYMQCRHPRCVEPSTDRSACGPPAGAVPVLWRAPAGCMRLSWPLSPWKHEAQALRKRYTTRGVHALSTDRPVRPASSPWRIPYMPWYVRSTSSKRAYSWLVLYVSFYLRSSRASRECARLGVFAVHATFSDLLILCVVTARRWRAAGFQPASPWALFFPFAVTKL